MPRLPMSIIAIIAMAIIVLAVLVALFFAGGGGGVSEAELKRTFSLGCLEICQRADRTELNIPASYPAFAQACERLYDVRGAYLQCLDRCGGGCLRPVRPCEYLCTFRKLVTDFGTFCADVKVHPATRGTYGGCDCSCP